MLKKKSPSAGAPEWVLTYGDMMSLLLCFFILLAAFADYEQGGSAVSIASAIQSIQEALGMPRVKSEETESVTAFNTLVEQIKLALADRLEKNRSDAPDKGMQGRNFRLRRIREGLEIVVGGPVVFEPFSAEMTAETRGGISALADTLKGHRNMLEVRGHAAEATRGPGWTYLDALELSYHRTRSVATELVTRGVDPRTLRLVAAGRSEPSAREIRSAADRDKNRSVEIIVREALIDDFTPPSSAPAEASAG